MKLLRTRHCWAMAIMLVLITQTAEAENATEGLDPRIRGLLQEEMRAIEGAMQSVLSAIVRGQHEVVEERGQAIHDSFILAQSLSEEDRRTLRAALPGGFVELDKAFHGLAAELSESGTQEDSAAQLDVFQQMTESCLQCHQTYAPDRFKRLSAR